MSQDTFGPTQIPLAPIDATDPLLTYCLSYIKAVCNAYAAAAWRTVYKITDGSLPVKSTFSYNPHDLVFNEKSLPAMYMFRTGSESIINVGQDVRVQTSKVTLQYVLPPAVQADRSARDTFNQALVKLIDDYIERGHDVSWKVTGDSYPSRGWQAANGSVLWHWVPVRRMRITSSGTPKPLMIEVDGPNGTKMMRGYPAWETVFEVEEQFDSDISRFDQLAGIDQSIGDATNTEVVVEQILT